MKIEKYVNESWSVVKSIEAPTKALFEYNEMIRKNPKLPLRLVNTDFDVPVRIYHPKAK